MKLLQVECLSAHRTRSPILQPSEQTLLVEPVTAGELSHFLTDRVVQETDGTRLLSVNVLLVNLYLFDRFYFFSWQSIIQA